MHKKLSIAAITLFVFAAMFAISGCSTSGQQSSQGSSSTSTSMSTSTTSSDGVTTIQPKEAKQMIDNGGVTIVDVRTQSEYETAHIPGAILVLLDTIDTGDIAALPDMDATLIVYCRTGVRSMQASKQLVLLGYTHVYNMDGGINAWTYDTVSGSDPQ